MCKCEIQYIKFDDGFEGILTYINDKDIKEKLIKLNKERMK
jgi:hypothetical protein